MLQDYRVRQIGSLFSEGVELEGQISPAERRRRRMEVLRETPGRKFARTCSDITYALSPSSLLSLPSTIDFIVREKGIGVAGLPDARLARNTPDGLAGLVGELSPSAIVDGYGRGMFLRWLLGNAAWWAPAERMVASPNGILEGAEALALLQSGEFHITIDRAFDAVIAAATSVAVDQRRPYAPSSPGMSAFCAVFDAGFAHSVEVRDASGKLAGGLYGIAAGRVFIIQALFELREGLADLAVAALARHLKHWEFELIDGCAETSLERIGFVALPRQQHIEKLNRLLQGGRPGRWLVSEDLLKA